MEDTTCPDGLPFLLRDIEDSYSLIPEAVLLDDKFYEFVCSAHEIFARFKAELDNTYLKYLPDWFRLMSSGSLLWVVRQPCSELSTQTLHQTLSIISDEFSRLSQLKEYMEYHRNKRKLEESN